MYMVSYKLGTMWRNYFTNLCNIKSKKWQTLWVRKTLCQNLAGRKMNAYKKK